MPRKVRVLRPASRQHGRACRLPGPLERAVVLSGLGGDAP